MILIAIGICLSGIPYLMSHHYNEIDIDIKYDSILNLLIDNPSSHQYNPSQPNELLIYIANQYTEFGHRFFYDINNNSNWIQFLSIPNMNKTNICLHLLDDQGGLGNRIFRDPVAYFIAFIHECTLSLHWGTCQDYTNYFNDLFVDSFELIASNWSVLNDYNRKDNNHFILPNITHHSHIQIKRIHDTMSKILPYTEIFVEINTASNYDQYVIYEDFQMVQEKQIRKDFIDQDIDDHYGELRRWDGYMKWSPALRFYGLLIQQLRKKYRMEMVKFLQCKFKNRFIISIHLRTGIGESGYNRHAPLVIDIINQINISVDKVFNQFINHNHYLKNKKIGFFLSGDNSKLIQMFQNDTFDIFDKYCLMYNNNNNDKCNSNGNDDDIFTRTKVEWTLDTKSFSFGKDSQNKDCVVDAKDAYIDSELLGLSDVLILPYVSTFNKLSRALMMKRKKIICHCIRNLKKHTANWYCKNFKTQHDIKFVNDITFK